MKEKKILKFWLLVIILIVIAFLPEEVSAYVEGNLTYEINQNEVKITDCEETATSVEIPTTLQGRPVTEIAEEAFYNCTNLETITIPEGVKYIEREAFGNCTNLTSIVLPESVTDIGGYTFQNCSKLESVRLPSNMQSISEGTFYDCTSLREITLPNNLTEIWFYAFKNCSSLESITLGEKVAIIKNSAFEGCSGLKSINIPEKVTCLPSRIFADCTNLQSLIILPTVTQIEDGAFSGNYQNLKFYVVTGSAAEEYALNNGIPYELYELPEKEATLKYQIVVNEITNQKEAIVVGCDMLATKATIPATYKGYPVVQIESIVFENHLGLKNIVIPAGVREVRRFFKLY